MNGRQYDSDFANVGIGCCDETDPRAIPMEWDSDVGRSVFGRLRDQRARRIRAAPAIYIVRQARPDAPRRKPTPALSLAEKAARDYEAAMRRIRRPLRAGVKSGV
jgi:hypothetical protein